LIHGVAFLCGISTPSLSAQGEQRRLSYFNIDRDNARKYWTEGQLQRLIQRNRDLFFDRWQHCLSARANGSAPPQQKFDARAWSAMIGNAGAAETAVESAALKAARDFAQFDRHVGYLSAVISSQVNWAGCEPSATSICLN
jgi:hypothetical protein